MNKDCKSDIVLEGRDTSDNRYLEFYYYDTKTGLFGLIKSIEISKDFSIGTVQNIN